MELYMKCPMCGGKYYLVLTTEQASKLAEYKNNGGFVQEVFPELNAVEREFIKTGYCPSCQEMLFGNGASELIHERS